MTQQDQEHSDLGLLLNRKQLASVLGLGEQSIADLRDVTHQRSPRDTVGADCDPRDF